MEDIIRRLSLEIGLKYKKNLKQRNQHLKNLIKFVKQNDVFKGRRKKLYKIINSHKKK